MKPISKMDISSWELNYDNALLDENRKVLNVSEFAVKYSSDFIIRRFSRFYVKNGSLYLAPAQCTDSPHPVSP